MTRDSDIFCFWQWKPMGEYCLNYERTQTRRHFCGDFIFKIFRDFVTKGLSRFSVICHAGAVLVRRPGNAIAKGSQRTGSNSSKTRSYWACSVLFCQRLTWTATTRALPHERSLVYTDRQYATHSEAPANSQLGEPTSGAQLCFIDTRVRKIRNEASWQLPWDLFQNSSLLSCR